MSATLTQHRIDILDYLKESSDFKTTKQIQNYTGRTYHVVSRDLRILLKLKCIKRVAAETGHQFLYEYRTHIPRVNQTQAPGPVKPERYTSEQVAMAYNSWSTNGWQPKILEAIWNLSDVIGRLGELAALSSIHGETIDKSLVIEQREALMKLYEAANSVMNETQRILATKELWDNNRLSEFLLEHFEAEDLLTKSKSIQALRTLQGVLDRTL